MKSEMYVATWDKKQNKVTKRENSLILEYSWVYGNVIQIVAKTNTVERLTSFNKN